ncbi:hypothetical protein HPB50_022435 [Hyalomma asiaticum]|uniref:Uncharacterized protein n=1 Tax=Hyalomma asiaticum TaxID=266040 RepID=A0ACB7TLF7_HYAAI|nr:hypothetical protein HPB50_022435 [Hyalomma asiaticum]
MWWLSLGKCLTLEQWQALVSFFLNETKLKNQQRPNFLGLYQISKTAAALQMCGMKSSEITRNGRSQEAC